MPKFGTQSKQHLAECHQDLQTVFNEVIKVTDCSIICGHRGEYEQNLAYDRGYSKLKFPKSYHNSVPSMAADAVPYPLDWNDIEAFHKLAEVVLNISQSLLADGKISHRVEAGINWKGFVDAPHYQLKKIV
jgi:hypothetical protein